MADGILWALSELDLDLSDWFYPCEASLLRTTIQQDLQHLFDVEKQTKTCMCISCILYQSLLV